MNFQDITENEKEIYNQAVGHPLQAYEWGEFRKKTGVDVVRRAQISDGKVSNPFQLTIHKTPLLPMNIGYFPKGTVPTEALLSELKNLGKSMGVSYVQLEPNVDSNEKQKLDELGLKDSFHPLFTKYSFLLDLALSEEELLKGMHQKTRYNVRLSEKRGVKVEIDNSQKAFERYIELTKETSKRQAFYAHNEKYHRLMWETLAQQGSFDSNLLQANLLKATFEGKTLVTWILFTFKDTLYYPYGASSDENREVMASSLIMWEAIKFGKKLGLRKFDMWGAAPPDASPSHEWYGFHRFKEGFGPKLQEFAGSFDLVLNPTNYEILKVGDKMRWAYLKLRSK